MDAMKLAVLKANWDNTPSSSDAWKLMIYRCDACDHQERIWNARPHVTPFGGVPCPNCFGPMTHAFFGSDTLEPFRWPQRGDLVFIDLPPELALIFARRRIAAGQIAGYQIPEEHTTETYARELALQALADFGGHPPAAMRLLS
jgi:hypothetical protein